MKRNIGKKLKDTKGITLVALVVTIIVLLILAGVALSSVLSQDGIFHRAGQATDKYGQAKARETLELALGEAQMKKYDEGLTDEELDEQIKKVGSLIPKEDPESKYQLVIVEGHIFEIDRSVPKIVDYKGPADGIIITASVSQNENWQNPVATVTGTITKYGGGSVVSSSATATNGVTIPADFPTTGGSFKIENITTDTDITITAKDSEGHDQVTEVIKVRLKRDTTPPTLSDVTAEVDGMNITISARATDNESGLKQINYTVEPNTVTLSDGTNGSSKTLTSGQVLELTATVEGEYTITFTATDNVGNTSAGVTKKVKVIDGLSLADLKKITPENYSEYLGKKVDYNPTGGGVWRVFYVEDSANTFGDGVGTIYLKRDVTESKNLNEYVNKGMTAKGLEMMKKLNLEWKNYKTNASKTTTDTFSGNEIVAVGLCDTDNWTTYATGDSRLSAEGFTANYAIGSAPIEMWVKVQNEYVNKLVPSATKIGCGIKSDNGYGYKINGSSLVNVQSVSLDKSNDAYKVLYTDSEQWLASPSPTSPMSVCDVASSSVGGCYYTNNCGLAPVVSLSF